MPPLLEIRGLRKHYPQVEAVRGVDFSIEAGSCFGLLGPNGAGKSTTVEILEGVLEPSAGEIRYRGKPRAAEFRQRAGIMFQSTALQDLITVGEALELFASFYRHTRPMAELVELCDLGGFLDRETKKTSGGQRQRLLLAIALVNDPEILFLDEPTTGLDPQARRNFWNLVHKIKDEGKTLILTTHYMEEAWELCDEIAIMDRGTIIAQGSPHGLLRKHFDNAVITFPLTAKVQEMEDPQGEEIVGVFRDKRELELVTTNIEHTLRGLVAGGYPLEGIEVRSPNLEDLFLELTGHKLRP
jgi:ABC-2 type transport system ATP-binding protein